MFFKTPTMRDHTWKKPARTNRHVLTRYAVHGFHSKLCAAGEACHEAKETCVCRRCGDQCPPYHGAECPLVESLNSLAS